MSKLYAFIGQENRSGPDTDVRIEHVDVAGNHRATCMGIPYLEVRRAVYVRWGGRPLAAATRFPHWSNCFVQSSRSIVHSISVGPPL